MVTLFLYCHLMVSVQLVRNTRSFLLNSMIESCHVSQDPAAGPKSDVLLSPVMTVIRGQPDNLHLGRIWCMVGAQIWHFPPHVQLSLPLPYFQLSSK